MTKTFISGLQLSERFYGDVLRPILDQHFPNLPHTAALIGHGSEILGYDDAMSTDHDWGLRLQLFVQRDDYFAHQRSLDATLKNELPDTYAGYPTKFALTRANEISHRVTIHTPRSFVHGHLNFAIDEPIDSADWLTFPQHNLLGLTAGRIFHDGVDLAPVRNRFAYFPDDVWFYLLAAGWQRISQEEHLMGRAGLAGSEIGSALIAGRLVHDVMMLCFLMARRYTPYPKWFGKAFGELACAAELTPVLMGVLSAETWEQREHHLSIAYQHLARMHNELQITEPIATAVTPFFDRPFQVITTNGIIPALLAQIKDETLLTLTKKPLIGSIDQFSNSTDFVSHVRWRPAVRQLYNA